MKSLERQNDLFIERHPFWSVFTIALIVRLVFAVSIITVVGSNGFLMEDSQQYLVEAQILHDTGSFFGISATGEAKYSPQVMPLVPIILFILGVTDPSEIIRFIVFQVIIDSLTCCIILRLGEKISAKCGILSGLVAAFNPTQIVMCLILLTETTSVFFTTLALLACINFLFMPTREGRSKLYALTALAIGFAGGTMVRLATLPLGILSSLGLVVLSVTRKKSLRSSCGAILATTCIWIAFTQIVPLRNYLYYQHYEYTNQSGVHLLYWVVPLVKDFGSGIPQAETRERASELFKPYSFQKKSPSDDFTESENMQLIGRRMLLESGGVAITKAWIIGAGLNLLSPAITVQPTIRGIPHNSFYETPGNSGLEKIVQFITAQENRLFVSVNAVAALGTVGLFLMGLVGLNKLYKVNPIIAVIFVCWILYFLLLSGPVASPKYRLPFEPVWCVLIAVAVVNYVPALISKYRKHRLQI
jgi:hypothetical protein